MTQLFYACSALISCTILAADFDAQAVRLEHITTAEQVENLLITCPDAFDDVLEEGYEPLPDVTDFSPKLSMIMNRYPVWGTWLITYRGDVIGRITLLRPHAKNGRSEIFTWVKAPMRKSGVGSAARRQLYEIVLPHVGHPVIVGEVVDAVRDTIAVTTIDQYRGVLSRISIENHGSIISQLRSGAEIFAYDGEGPRVSMLHLAFPAPALHAETLARDAILHRMKTEIEPNLIYKETRHAACDALRVLERGSCAPQASSNRGLLHIRHVDIPIKDRSNTVGPVVLQRNNFRCGGIPLERK